MNRKLLILLFCFSCASIRPSDPLLIEHALQNESDEGFISREFFQVKVEVPYPMKEMSGKEKREECKKIAFLQREDKTLKYLLDVHRDKYRFGDGVDAYDKSKLGQQRVTRNKSYTSTTSNAAATTNTQTTSTTPGTTQTPGTSQTSGQQTSTIPGTPGQPDPKLKSNVISDKPYSQVFSWFLSEMKLYKEDYTDKSKCTFLFRNIQKDLYAKVEETVIPNSIFKKEERKEDDFN
jgi:hypothetical protein